jgi:polyadenylate-binding protein
VQFEHEEHAVAAKDAMNGHELNGKKIEVIIH